MKKSIVEFTRPHLEAVQSAVVAIDWRDKSLYGDMLAQTYYHICHSTRLLAAAGARFGMADDKFHLQCMKHAGEERSHETLALSDLKRIGGTLADFPELPSTKNLYRSAYYLIEHESPICLFGYAYFLECIAIYGGGLIEKPAREAFGANAVKHLAVHGKEDVDHIQAYEKELISFTGERRAWLEESIVTTAQNYERMFLEIQGRSSAGREAA